MGKERYVYEKIYKNYGEIVLTIEEVLKKKHMNVYRLSRLTGINWSVIQKYVEGKLYRVDLDLLSRMCFALNCRIEDLLHYKIVKDNHKNRKRRKNKNKSLNR